MKLTKLLSCLVTALALLGTGLPAHAGMIGTDQMRDSVMASVPVERAAQREWIVDQLQLGGVEESRAVARVASMTDAEVADVFQRLDEMPAGGISSEVILVGIIVFLVLELMGVIDVIPDN